MNTLLRPFVPHNVAEEISQRPDENPVGRESRLTAVALFADVSGFTAISEALGRSGRRGTEELTGILNSYFEPMIALIQSYGGIVGKFGGDAMTVLFPYDGRSRRATIRRAIQCAVDMQARMTEYEAIPTSAGNYSLAMKAGLAAGRLLCLTVGRPDQRLEYLIAGKVLDECADAEHQATRGEVVVANDLLAAAGGVEIVEERGAFTCISRLRRRARQAPLPLARPMPDAAGELLARFIHPSIAERLRRGQAGFIDEHRQVTVIFARFEGIDYDNDPAASGRLQGYLSQVMAVIRRYDGYLNKVDMGDKGSKFIALFGAPVSHEDDEERALRCALEMSALPDCPVRIGVNSGFVYSGQVGSSARREYTVMGDTVNLAARLMQAAGPGEILAGGATWMPVHDRFLGEALAPMSVKGKAAPVSVYAVRGILDQKALSLMEPIYDLPMVGRRRELAEAEQAIAEAAAGRGQVLGISGEAGMGKSRFGAEVVRRAAEAGFTLFGGACQSYGRNRQYLVWRDIWRAGFGLLPAWSEEEQLAQVAHVLEEADPQLLIRLPLLVPLLNLEIAENDLTRALEPQMRAELLRSLLHTLLSLRAQAGPVLLILEDCHWIDPLSQELLAYLGRNLADLPVLLLVLYRPESDAPSPLAWATPADPVTEITLGEMGPEEAAELARLKLNRLWATREVAYESPAALVEQIIERAQGNPFYLEEIVNYIHDRGIDPSGAVSIEQLAIPDSLHSLILSRIDQLAEAQKTTLKVASVIGRSFPESWVWGSYPPVGQPDAVHDYLVALSRLDLTPLQDTDPEPAYLFKHITTQEVAYESLAFATRSLLHEGVGLHVERAYGRTLNQAVDLLAHHFGRSNNQEKQRRYFRLAADVARDAFANDASIEYYQRLLPLLPAGEKGQVQLELARIQQLVGAWPESEKLYRQAWQAAGEHDQAAVRAACALGLGELLFLSGSDEAEGPLDWLERAKSGYEALGDRQGIGRALEKLSFVLSQQGEYDRAMAFAQQRLAIAQEGAGDPVGKSNALDQMGMASIYLGDLAQGLTYFEEALAEATAADHKMGIMIICNDLAGGYFFQGDYGRSLEYLYRGQAVAEEIGYREGLGFSMGNAGLAYEFTGQYDEALRCYAQALSIAVELGNKANIVPILGSIAEVDAAQGRPERAIALFAKGAELARALNLPYRLCELLQKGAALRFGQGRLEEAAALNQEAMEVAGQVDRGEVRFEAELLAARLDVALGREEAAAVAMRLREMAEATPPGPELAALHYEMWRLTGETTAGETAGEMYRQLYEGTPNVTYRRRHVELTGETLPDPPPLPPVPQLIPAEKLHLEPLLVRAGVAPAG